MSKPTIIGSDNGLAFGWHQAVIWTIDRILLIRTLGTNHWNLKQNSYIFIQENVLQNIVWEMVVIFSASM